MIDYNHAYLSGFLAEKYDVDKDAAFSDAKLRTINSTKSEMLDSVKGYATRTITSSKIEPVIKGTEYVLLPVWMVNVKYNNKFYLFAMNGESGRFIGNIPLDKKKAVLYTFLTFIISFIVILILSYIAFKGGD